MTTKRSDMLLFVILWMVGLGGSGCGEPDLGLGTYEGQVELYNATSFAMRTDEEQALVALTRDPSGQVFVGINSRCAFEASLDGGSLTVPKQTCVWEGQRTNDSWEYEGSGTIEGEVLTLELSGGFERTYKDGSAPLSGNHRYTFMGSAL